MGTYRSRSLRDKKQTAVHTYRTLPLIRKQSKELGVTFLWFGAHPKVIPPRVHQSYWMSAWRRA